MMALFRDLDLDFHRIENAASCASFSPSSSCAVTFEADVPSCQLQLSSGIVARIARRLLNACFADGPDVPDAAQVQGFTAS